MAKDAEADALLLMLEGPTDWDEIKQAVGTTKILVAADTPEFVAGAAEAGLPTVVLDMADQPVYEKLTQALLEAVADDILVPGARRRGPLQRLRGRHDRLDQRHPPRRPPRRLTARDLRQLETRVPLDTLKTVVDLAVEIGREGREGKPVGTLFVVGDHAQGARASSHPTGFDPVKGYSRKERNLHEPRVREGDQGNRPDGRGVHRSRRRHVEAACRLHRRPGDQHHASQGPRRPPLGRRRHQQSTNAIAVAVSESSGTVRIFQNGEVMLRIEPFRRPMKWKDFEYEPPSAGMMTSGWSRRHATIVQVPAPAIKSRFADSTLDRLMPSMYSRRIRYFAALRRADAAAVGEGLFRFGLLSGQRRSLARRPDTCASPRRRSSASSIAPM